MQRMRALSLLGSRNGGNLQRLSGLSVAGGLPKKATSLSVGPKYLAGVSTRNYETLAVKTVAPYVTHVEINRPEKLNSMNKAFWRWVGESNL
jgi:hypothetical protein